MTQTLAKVLIVDDDQFLLNMYASKFSKEGIEVDTASSSREALDKLENGLKPDVILLDIIMPDVNGLEVLREIKEKNLAEESLVIMLTNQGQQEDIDTAKELGVNGYIVKATSVPSEVVDEVKRMYNEHHAA